MTECVKRDIGYLVLTATKQGERVYRKFGFRDLNETTVLLDLYYSTLSKLSY